MRKSFFISEVISTFDISYMSYITSIQTVFSNQNVTPMNITFDELRRLKHSLPHGSVNRIAKDLNRDAQEVRNFFGAVKFKGATDDWHYEPGPDGGIVNMRDTSIFDAAQRILRDTQRS